MVVTLLVDGDISWVGQLPHESIDITGRCRELPVNEDSNAIHVIPFTLRPVSSLNKKVISSLASTFTDTGQLAPTYNAESLSSSSSSGERPDGGDTCAISSIEAQVWRCRRVDNPLSSLDHLSTPPFDSDSAHILYSTKLRREGCASDGYNNAGYNDEGFYIPEMEIIIVDHGELILVERISDTPISSHTLILNRTNDE